METMGSEKRRVQTLSPWSAGVRCGEAPARCLYTAPAPRHTFPQQPGTLLKDRSTSFPCTREACFVGRVVKGPTPLLRSLSQSHYPVCFLHPTDVVPKSSSRLPHEHPRLRNRFQGNEPKTNQSFITAVSAYVTAARVPREEVS